jgi:histidinol-phosphate phosphatase family protein
MNRPTQAVILCGGLGTRLKPYTNELPKPMILCNERPFIWYLLEQLSEQGVKQFILLTGYMGEKIENYFGDGRQWGWQIEYSQGPVEWDTGKRIWEARQKIDDRFLLLYSDNFTPLSLDKVFKTHEKHKPVLTFIVSEKSPGNISLNAECVVQSYDNNRSDDTLKYVEIGYMTVEKERMLKYFETPNCSFSSILRKIAASREICAFVQHDTYHSISDPVRWKKTEAYLKLKKIILIDRDGVINSKALAGQYVGKWDEFEWIEDTVQSMKNLSDNGFSFIVITNQAGIARGIVCEHQMNEMHKLMVSELETEGIEVHDIYICPHHWDDDCLCRKPKAGMFYKASREWLLRLDQTLYIGDDPRDCQAAYNAGCKGIYIGDNSDLHHLHEWEKPIYSSQKLSECIPAIINFYKENKNYDYH